MGRGSFSFVQAEVAAVQLKENVVVARLCEVVETTRRICRESNQVRRNRPFFDLWKLRREPVEDSLLGYHLTRSDWHFGDHLSHELACRLVIYCHAHRASPRWFIFSFDTPLHV